MKNIKIKLCLLLLFTLTLLICNQSYADKNTDILARKLAVTTYYDEILNKKYGMAVLSIQDKNEETLQISMVRITKDRIDEVLNTGLYKEAKKAKFKTIKFIDINKEVTIVEVR